MLLDLVAIAIPLAALALLIACIWLFVKWQRALQLVADRDDEVAALQAALRAWSGFRRNADD